MSYFDDYLSVLPQVDAEAIRKVIHANEEVMAVQNLSEEEFERLIYYVAEKEMVQTPEIKLDPKITADDFNRFYSGVAIDLQHLFLEQRLFEGLTENYQRIFEGNLDELRNHLNLLIQRVKDLEMEKGREEGVVVHSYDFHPNQLTSHIETDPNQQSSYLWVDRDGSLLSPAQTKRHYHQHFACLNETHALDLLKDDAGNPNATITILEESPYVITPVDNKSDIGNVIDGIDGNYWVSVALKPNTAVEKMSINVEGGK